MKLNRLTPCQKIEIWQPRYKDKKVLIAKFRVGTHNEIVFTKAKTLQGSWYMSGEDIRSYPIETNGVIDCYCVPLNDLQVLERV